MGTFGLGGLHRKSTWIYPVPTLGALPPTAVDGSVAIILDINAAFQYDAALPGWVPLGGAGPTGFNRTLWWPVGATWNTIYSQISALGGGAAVLLVEQDTLPRTVTAGTFDLTNVVFVGMAKDRSSSVDIDVADGVRLATPTLRSKDILWRPLETTGYIYSGSTNSYFEFDGGGLTAITSAGAHPHFRLTGTSNTIELRNSAVVDATGWSSTTEDAIILLPSGAVAKFTMTAGAVLGPNIITSSVATTSTITHDASSSIDSNAARNSATLTTTLLDQALYVYYDDTLVVPALGASNVQDAVDLLKSQELREVLLTFSATVASGTAINIQTGVYAGAGSPATVDNDTNVTLPTTGSKFKDDARIEVILNGQDLTKGDGSGNGEAEWVSTTQIKLSMKIKNLGEVMVRAPFPTA
jgi:hypothetical protein